MHCDTGDVGAADLDLAGVESGADVETDRAECVADRAGAANRTSGTVEGGHDPVTGVVDLLAAEPLEFRAYEHVMGRE